MVVAHCTVPVNLEGLLPRRPRERRCVLQRDSVKPVREGHPGKVSMNTRRSLIANSRPDGGPHSEVGGAPCDSSRLGLDTLPEPGGEVGTSPTHRALEPVVRMRGAPCGWKRYSERGGTIPATASGFSRWNAAICSASGKVATVSTSRPSLPTWLCWDGAGHTRRAGRVPRWPTSAAGATAMVPVLSRAS